MNRTIINQLIAIAEAGYYNALAILCEMLRQYAAKLGLMAPGIPEQLAVPNGVGVTQNGVPVYYAAVKCRRNAAFRSPLAFGQAVQEALDEVAYANCLNRLILLRVDTLGNGYIGLTFTVGG